jgi:hypothetical protein
MGCGLLSCLGNLILCNRTVTYTPDAYEFQQYLISHRSPEFCVKCDRSYLPNADDIDRRSVRNSLKWTLAHDLLTVVLSVDNVCTTHCVETISFMYVAFAVLILETSLDTWQLFALGSLRHETWYDN